MKMTPNATAPAPQRKPRAAHAPHLTNRPLAEALFAAASGDPLTVVTAPPGAGKTFTITHLAHQLATRMGLRVAIAAQTREQALDVANRTAALGAPTKMLLKRAAPRPQGLTQGVRTTHAGAIRGATGVIVATTARWQWTRTEAYTADILLIDEAYQLPYAALLAIGDLAPQVVMVGDPGQIDPVITGDTTRWEGHHTAPHLPAPIAMANAHPRHTTRVTLDQTHRLGPHTTAVAQLLYPALPFTSARPPEHVTHRGADLPEYATTPLHITAGPTDPTLTRTAADLALDLLDGATYTTVAGSRPLGPHDIAVIAPHVNQQSLIAAALAHHPDILVSTINAAQGLERPVVLAIHPMAGRRTTAEFATDLGRLCVTITRHRAHLNLITDTYTPGLLTPAATDAAIATNLAVLQALDAGC